MRRTRRPALVGAGLLPGAFLPPGWRPDRDAARTAARPSERLLADHGLRIRPIGPGDGPLLVTGFERLSPESRYRRFLAPVPRLTPSLLASLTDVDHVHHFAWAAFLDPVGEGVAIARFVRLADPAAADPAVTVLDAYQGQGIGGALLDALVLEAADAGVTRFEGLVLADNRPSRRMLARAGAGFERDGGAQVRFRLDVTARAAVLAPPPPPAARRGASCTPVATTVETP
jgi:GNAT superfamily N-acetyltransferase